MDGHEAKRRSSRCSRRTDGHTGAPRDHRAEGLTPGRLGDPRASHIRRRVAALIAYSLRGSVPVALLVSLAAVALALDAVDGWVARRTRTTDEGARFDAEVDAFLILILSAYVARSAGAWVLVIGAARYVFLAAGWALPWMPNRCPRATGARPSPRCRGSC